MLLGVRSGDLGPARLARVDDLHRRTVAEEDALSREMAQVQEGHTGLVATTAGAGLDLDVDAMVARAAELLIAAADLEIGFHEFGLQYGSARDE
ncbi:hypothetical protein U9M48_033114 [Paspalum notatum var. saurae]|uniref:Uncharacterized protein n=1 Tax=Paspalum notatum var. saurae TaxID=547442 RepID=A0AAQ3U6N1_PASNO